MRCRYKFEVGRFIALIQGKNTRSWLTFPCTPPPPTHTHTHTHTHTLPLPRNVLFLYLPQFSRLYEFKWLCDQFREDFFSLFFIYMFSWFAGKQKPGCIYKQVIQNDQRENIRCLQGVKTVLNETEIFQHVY